MYKVDKDSLVNLMNIFVSDDEVRDFVEALYFLNTNLSNIFLEINTHLAKQEKRKSTQEEEIEVVKHCVSSLLTFVLFCRQNIDTIHDLIKNIEFHQLEEDEKQV